MEKDRNLKGFGYFWLPAKTGSCSEIPDDPKEYMAGELSFSPDSGGLLTLKAHPRQEDVFESMFVGKFMAGKTIDLLHGDITLDRGGKMENTLVTLRTCQIAHTTNSLYTVFYQMIIGQIFENKLRFFHREEDMQFEELYLDYSYLMQWVFLCRGMEHRFEYDFQDDKLQAKFEQVEYETLKLFEDSQMIIDLDVITNYTQNIIKTGAESRARIVVRHLTGKRHFDDNFDLIDEILPNFITLVTGKESFPTKISGRTLSATKIKEWLRETKKDGQKDREYHCNRLPSIMYIRNKKYENFDEEKAFHNESLFERDVLKDIIHNIENHFTKWIYLYKDDKLRKMLEYYFEDCRNVGERFSSFYHALMCYMQHLFGHETARELYVSLYEKLKEEYEDILKKLFNDLDEFKWRSTLTRNYLYHEEVHPRDVGRGKNEIKWFEKLKIKQMVEGGNEFRQYCWRLEILLKLCILIELEIPVGIIKPTIWRQIRRL